MLERRINSEIYRPLPISFIIQTANTFGCDIYIKSEKTVVNVKRYEELHGELANRHKNITIYFDGEDEKEAVVKFQSIFQI